MVVEGNGLWQIMHPSMHPFTYPSIHPFIHPSDPFQYLYNSILPQTNFCGHCLIAQDHRAHLHKNTGLDSREKVAINQYRDPVGRVETVAGHIVAAPPRSPLYLIQPYSPPFVYKKIRYWMNGSLTGELCLSHTYECQFHSALTGYTTPFHGAWQFCRRVAAIQRGAVADGQRPALGEVRDHQRHRGRGAREGDLGKHHSRRAS